MWETWTDKPSGETIRSCTITVPHCLRIAHILTPSAICGPHPYVGQRRIGTETAEERLAAMESEASTLGVCDRSQAFKQIPDYLGSRTEHGARLVTYFGSLSIWRSRDLTPANFFRSVSRILSSVVPK